MIEICCGATATSCGGVCKSTTPRNGKIGAKTSPSIQKNFPLSLRRLVLGLFCLSWHVSHVYQM